MANYSLNNPKKSFEKKPDFSVQAHVTLRVQHKEQRIEIGLRIPPEFEQRIYDFVLKKKKKNATKKKAKSAAAKAGR
ncbi:MAG: hypothetical protein WBQ19_17740 [Terriglobales bacterium]